MSVGPAAVMNQIVAPDRIQLWIRKESKRVTGLLTQFIRFFGRIHADSYWTNASILKLLQIFLNPS